MPRGEEVDKEEASECARDALAATCAISAVAEFKTPPKPQNVPELMRSSSGEEIASVAAWEKVRRPEILKIMQEQEYGVRPVERPADLAFAETAPVEECYGGKALRKRVKATYSGSGGKGEMNFSVWIPKAKHPVATFVHTSPRPAYWLPVEDISFRADLPLWRIATGKCRSIGAISPMCRRPAFSRCSGPKTLRSAVRQCYIDFAERHGWSMPPRN